MAYPRRADLNKLASLLWEHSQLKHEHGAKGIEKVYRKAERALRAALKDLQSLPINEKLAAKEPDDLEAIKALRPRGQRRMWERFDAKAYVDRLHGAMLGRFAGCTLGAPVEFWSIDGMEKWAKEIGQPFPPVEYWRQVPNPCDLRVMRATDGFSSTHCASEISRKT